MHAPVAQLERRGRRVGAVLISRHAPRLRDSLNLVIQGLIQSAATQNRAFDEGFAGLVGRLCVGVGDKMDVQFDVWPIKLLWSRASPRYSNGKRCRTRPHSRRRTCREAAAARPRLLPPPLEHEHQRQRRRPPYMPLSLGRTMQTATRGGERSTNARPTRRTSAAFRPAELERER